jgi:hypothetical protein
MDFLAPWVVEQPSVPSNGGARARAQRSGSKSRKKRKVIKNRLKRKCFNNNNNLQTCTAVRVKKLQANDPDKLHFMRCKSRDQCLQCKFAMVKTKYKMKYPWLQGQTNNETMAPEFTLRCSFCSDAKVACLWATPGVSMLSSLTSISLQRHQASATHKAVVQNATGIVGGRLVPDTSLFSEVLSLYKKKTAVTKRPKGVSRNKQRKVVYCLAESIRQLTRKVLRGADVACLMQDCRKGRLQIRFSCCSPSMTSTRGVFGEANLARDFDCSADGIKQGTLQILKNYCTPRSSLPFKRTSMKPYKTKRLVVLYRHVCRIVELFTADAAADEQLAGAKLRDEPADLVTFAGSLEESRAENGYKVAFPHLRIVNKDTTHAARRIISRTLYADEFMKDIMWRFIKSRSSIAQRIQHSQIFSERFRANVQAVNGEVGMSGKIKNLRAAQHRHESLQTPLGRSVLFCKALLVTAEQIANERRGKPEGQDCLEFMQFISTEVLVQLAMMADCSDEIMMLIRFTDTEEHDPGELQSECANCLARLTKLIDEGTIFDTGYTQFMLRILEKPMVFFPLGVAMSLGGPGALTNAVKVRALARMKNWLALARSVARAEFGHFELRSAMAMFSLAKTKVTREADDAKAQKTQNLQRIAKFLDVPSVQLKMEFDRLHPLAARIFDEENLVAKEAWRKAFEASQASTRRAATYPVKALLPALMRFAAYQWTTAGVEQSFSKGKLVAGEHRGCRNEGTINDELVITSDHGCWDEAEIIKGAKREWAEVYGDARTLQRADRMDRGLKRKRKITLSSLSNWVAKRRKAVGSAKPSAEGQRIANAAAHEASRDWSGRHDIELGFQADKELTNMVRALEDGCMLPSEVTRELKLVFSEHKRTKKQKRDAYNRAKSRHRDCLRKDAPLDFTQKQNVFFDCDLNVPTSDFAKALRDCKLTRVYDRHRADLFIVDNLGKIGGRTRWAAILVGGVVSLIGCILKPGLRTPAIAYKPALSMKRTIWFSSGFMSKHSEICNITADALRILPNKWSVLISRADAIRQGGARARSGNSSELIVFVTSMEQKHDAEQRRHGRGNKIIGFATAFVRQRVDWSPSRSKKSYPAPPLTPHQRGVGSTIITFGRNRLLGFDQQNSPTFTPLGKPCPLEQAGCQLIQFTCYSQFAVVSQRTSARSNTNSRCRTLRS